MAAISLVAIPNMRMLPENKGWISMVFDPVKAGIVKTLPSWAKRIAIDRYISIMN